MGREESDEVIKVLNEVLTAELAAINQYFLHAKMFKDWGFERLHSKLRAESIDEMKHADAVIERVLYLGGLPNVQRLGSINIGENAEECLRSDLQAGIALCRQVGDTGSRLLLDEILASEEEHVDWLESQLELIAQVGSQNYLAEQIKA
jgi:bacterioferritin